MTTPKDESEDEVARAYRQASKEEAGSPAAATRDAILAAARAAALRRKPAANDSRYVWRAAAGIAVLGVALLLWRQADRHVAPDLTVRAPETESGTAVDNVGTAPAITPAPPAAAPAPNQAAPAAPAKDQRSAAPKAQAAREAQAPPARMDAAANGAAAPAADSQQLASASAAARVPPQTEAINYPQLVQREFPEEWNSTAAPPTLWVVMDARGNVLRKGSMTPGATVTADQPFESQHPWTMVRVKTASGRILPLAVMTIN